MNAFLHCYSESTLQRMNHKTKLRTISFHFDLSRYEVFVKLAIGFGCCRDT